MPDLFDQITASDAPGDAFDQITEDDVAKASSAPSAQTVEGALKSVPRPSLPITDEPSHGLYETFEQAKNRPAETPHVPLPAPTAKDIAAGVINAATDPMMGGAQAEPRPGTEAVQGASELVTPGKRLGGAAKLVNAAGEIASPVMGVGALEAPVSSLVGLGTGLAASKGARAVTKSAGGGEGAQDLAESLGFWIPSLTGAVLRPKVGVAITPEEVRVGAAIHPPGTDPMAATASFPRGGYKTEPPANGLEPTTIEGNPQSVTTPEEVQTAAASMAQAQQSEVAAQKMARGIPPEPPPAPPESHPEITPEAVKQVGEHIESLPKEQQAHAIVAAHTELAKGLLEQGKVVTPDGNIHVVRTEGQAESLAGKIINEEVKRRTEEENEPTKEPAAESAPKSGAAAQEPDAFDKITEQSVPDPPKDAFDQITGTLEKGTRVQLAGAPATVRHMSDAAGISVLRVEFDQPTSVPWSAKPVTKTSVPVKYQDKLQTLKGAESTNAVPESSVPVSSPASTGTGAGAEVKPVGTETVAGAKQDTSTFAAVKAEHPEWSMSQQLTEAAKRANVARDKPENGSTGEEAVIKSREQLGLPPKPGDVGHMRTSDLRVNANKFQYKMGTDASGTGTLLKETKVFNPQLAGTISVWRDPADGKTYVINGHHRYELAKRTGQKRVAVMHVAAKDAAEARAVGARQNIGEGRGTPVDAAKFFRETGVTPEDLDKHGISLGEATAARGLALSHLSEPLFKKVVQGELPLGHAVAIGEGTSDHAEQSAILKQIERREKSGAKVSEDRIREFIRLTKGAEQRTESTADLFGTQEVARSLAWEKSEVSEYIKAQLSKDKKLFGFVSKSGRAEELARAGNKIEVEKSKEISTQAAQAAEVYDKLSSRGGPISSILDEAARRLADGDNAGTVKAEAYDRIRAEVSKTLGGSQREVPEGLEKGTGRDEPTEERASQPEGPVEPTLPGMENVPAERAEATAEQQGKDLTAKLTEPPKSIEGKAGEIEQKSPLFRDTEANPQESLFSGESGYFEPGKIGEAATAEYQKEIKPALDKAGLTLGKALDELTHLIAPRAGIPIKTLDSAMKLTGVREQNRFVLEQTLAKAQTLFDKMPRDAQVSFVDNYKQGSKQATPQLQQISDFMGKADDATYRAVVEAQVGNLSPKAQSLWKSMSDGDKYSFVRKLADFKGDETLPNGPLKELANGLLTFKDDHYRVLWKVVPGKAEAKGTGSVRSVRPLEGSKGFLKQSTLATMSEGLERGGEPVDYNPVRMFQLSQADSWRYITAQRMWQDALTDGGRVFVKQGSQLPDGFRFVSDRIGNVRFQSDAGMVQAGQWAVREDWHRLLSNMLSHDYIRESTIGNGLMSVKNNLTAFRLSLSPFHALTTTVSSWANAVGRGLQHVNYAARNASLTALVEGAKDIATTPIAPIMDYRLGTSVVRYVTNPEEFVRSQRGMDFIKRYPEAAQLVDDLFSAGAKLSLHEDERLHGIEGLRQAVAENHYIAALLKTPIALNQQVMRPLFGYYVPRIKLATFLKDHSFELTDRGADISSGIKSRGEVARKTWDTTENIYGQMNWDARWWNRTLKSSIQLAFRAFTWFSGNVRLVKDAGIGQSKEAWESARWWNERLGGDSEPLPSSGPIPRIDPAFAKILGLGLVYMAANAALQYSMTREKPKDARDLFAARIGGVDAYGKPLRVVAPAIVLKDAMSLWGHGPWSYMRSKESDLISGISEVVNNEDFRHAMIHNPDDKWWRQRYDDAAHVLGSPISISNFQREKQYGESKAKAVLGAVGFSPAPAWISQTPLEKKIAEIQAANPGGPMAPETREQIDLKHSILGALRNGDSAPLEKAVEDGKLNHKEAQKLRMRARTNPLEDKIKGLAFMKSDKQVYSQLFQLSQTKGISEEESRVLNRMMAKKRTTMFKKGEGKEVAEAEE